MGKFYEFQVSMFMFYWKSNTFIYIFSRITFIINRVENLPLQKKVWQSLHKFTREAPG